MIQLVCVRANGDVVGAPQEDDLRRRAREHVQLETLVHLGPERARHVGRADLCDTVRRGDGTQGEAGTGEAGKGEAGLGERRNPAKNGPLV